VFFTGLCFFSFYNRRAFWSAIVVVHRLIASGVPLYAFPKVRDTSTLQGNAAPRVKWPVAIAIDELKCKTINFKTD
jgi:hypothetical protein